MADNSGDPHLLALLSKLAPMTPGVAGAVLSLAFGEKLTVRGKAFSVLGGFLCALWIAPAIVAGVGAVWPWGKPPAEFGSAFAFLTGLFGMIVLAGLAQAAAKYAGDPLKLIKFEVGGLRIGGGEA
ncbi:hypothetical protein [Caulobacter vibrioides]|uniref:hypothetical protein n=1 Tax=Caulobacter vibrioides TaxID=155892 RepID=UPI000BB47769|nr:hypothetical protein [Caulobacter vibrioides]ATC25222.1 hypothetical protein CA608_12120 [Caulobacter vibrioides]PLR13992.1 hypothetical protein CVUC_05420 [Caulobacter vibrioides]